MTKFQSIIQTHGSVEFPAFTGTRIYMEPVTIQSMYDTNHPYADTVWDMTVCTPIEPDTLMYLMIDEGFVRSGEAQRRRGMHIDGYWIDNNPILMGHGADRPNPDSNHGAQRPTERRHGGISEQELFIGINGHRSAPSSRWSPTPRHGASAHGPGHLPAPAHGPRHITNEWEAASFEAPEAIILASTHRACRGYIGQFEGPIKDGGDCEHIDLTGLTRISMDPFTSYVGNVTALHETMPVTQDCYRQLVRLNVPGWQPTLTS